MNYKINDAVDLSTVTFYTITSGLCFALGLLLMVFTLMLKGTVLTRISAWVLMTMALAFFLAGAAPNLPTWLPVVVVNVLLLISGLQLYSGVRAFVTQQALTVTPPKRQKALPLFVPLLCQHLLEISFRSF